eukprot:2744824-Ditylum_brightwellii.AAC.1
MARIVNQHKQGNEGELSRGNLYFDRGLYNGKTKDNVQNSWEWLPLACKGSEKFLYNVTNMNEEILKMFRLIFHVTRYTLTNDKNALNVYVDSQNPIDICELEQSHMNRPV